MKITQFIREGKMMNIWFSKQIGFMLSIGKNFETRRYITIEIPLFTIQVFIDKPKILR